MDGPHLFRPASRESQPRSQISSVRSNNFNRSHNERSQVLPSIASPLSMMKKKIAIGLNSQRMFKSRRSKDNLLKPASNRWFQSDEKVN